MSTSRRNVKNGERTAKCIPILFIEGRIAIA